MKSKNVEVHWNKSKKENVQGITLIALVVTTIVLLILAGVSLNLVAGSNGILGKAQKAVDVNNMAKIKEDIELKIAELQMDYYMTDNNFSNVNDYVKSELEKGVELPSGAIIESDSSGNLSYHGIQIGMLNSDGSVSIDGELSGSQIVTKYTVSYNANGGQGGPTSKKYAAGENVVVDFTTKPTKKGANFLGWATSSTATTPDFTNSGNFTMGTQNVTLYAVWEAWPLATATISATNYGDKVNYSANGVSDWKVFLNDESNVYLIASDRVPAEGLNKATNIENSGTNVYATDNRKTFIDWVTTNSYWSAYASGFSGATATGGPTLDQWIASWNAKGYMRLYSTTSSEMDDGLTGCYVGSSENPTSTWLSISNNEGYNDTLYYPGTVSGFGYWLVSPSAHSLYNVMIVSYDGCVHNGGYAYPDRGIRPLVKLPANAKINWNGTSWDLGN